MENELSGMFEVRVDDRNRVAVPARLMEAFRALSTDKYGNPMPDDSIEVVVGIGLQNKLCIFPKSVHQEMTGYLDKQPKFHPKWRKVRGVIKGSADPQVLDKQNRVRIPAALGKKYNLAGTIIIQGVGDHLEMASMPEWEKDLEDFGPMVDELFQDNEDGKDNSADE